MVPAYEEAPTIGRTIERLCSAFPDADVEFVAVDDGSRDDTAAVLAACALDDARVQVVSHPENRGLDAAIRTGFAHLSASTAVIVDADLSYGPDVLTRLLATHVRESAALVTASPYTAGGRLVGVPPIRAVLSRGANALVRLLRGGGPATWTCMVRSYDVAIARRMLAQPLHGELNVALMAAILAAGERVLEIPADLVWTRGADRAMPSAASVRRRGLAVLIAALSRGKLSG